MRECKAELHMGRVQTWLYMKGLMAPPPAGGPGPKTGQPMGRRHGHALAPWPAAGHLQSLGMTSVSVSEMNVSPFLTWAERDSKAVRREWLVGIVASGHAVDEAGRAGPMQPLGPVLQARGREPKSGPTGLAGPSRMPTARVTPWPGHGNRQGASTGLAPRRGGLRVTGPGEAAKQTHDVGHA